MAKYINLEELMKFPIRRNHYDKEHGNEDFICGIETVLEYAENLPTTENGVTVQEWISVDDRLPEEKVNCIVHYKHAYCDNDDFWAIGMCFYDGNKFQLYWSYKVTHWMPLPEPPKGERLWQD